METQGDLYFTMVYGVLDTHTNVLNYTVAGHPPIVHVPHGADPCLLPGDGFAIGMIDGVDFDEHTLQLNPGDRLYFYSDGVPEAMSPELEQFTNKRMLSSLQNGTADALSGKVDGLFAAVREWCLPNGPKDDVSILGCEIASPQS
jgi:sigma-B regulation protein RsbU (phosphoserine phosphatase)